MAWTVFILAVFAIGLTSCKKEKIDVPTVKVFEGAITIDITKASVSAEITDQGGAEVKLRGFVYGLSGGNLDTVFCGSGTGVYSAELNNLQPNTTYVYEAFAKNMGGLGTSGKVSFTTKPMPFYTIDVSANPSDGGRVSGGGSFQQGQYCTVMALANESYTFTNWTENDNEVSTDANYTFMVNGDRTLKANFTAQLPNGYTISLSANPNNGGSVSGGGTYQAGQSCTVSATANDGYAFANWTENGNEVSSDANYVFTVDGNRTLVANFTIIPPNSYAINVTASPSDGGLVTGGGTYQEGQFCTVTATVNDGYTFTNWTENGNVVSTQANYTFTVIGNRTLVANFTQQNYAISVSANPTNGGSVTGGGAYYYGDNCTVVATADQGYTFTNWTENGNVVSTNASYAFTVNANRNLVANFTLNSYSITATANPNEGGIVSGSGVYYYGQSCTVTATANSDYIFTNWTENGIEVSTDIDYTFTVNSNRSLVAHYTFNSQVPVGAINGLFTINDDGDKVYFSQGNLQYKASTGTWRFATNQYDVIGSGNSNISSSYSGWIDLFGWGTSGWNCGNTYYRPWDSNNSNGGLYGPPGNYNLMGSYANSDWGYYNAISNGGNQTHQWRTLTQSEWNYVFNQRNTTSGKRYAKAQVNGVNGVILLPDDWSTSFYSLSSYNSSGASYTSNVISSSNWTNYLEAHGAVFLPAAGYRNGTSVSDVGSSGYYWSASYFGSSDAYLVGFYDGGLNSSNFYYRYVGRSVRLVCPAE